MNLRQVLIDAARSHFAGHINKHIANIEVLLNNPAGIGEHQDIQEAIEIELGHIADYHDKLEMLNKFFMAKKGEENDKEISE
tara:strand:+ start:593 stop:838 length:246 start_codon:yes stop_codon:yes gene_type:complete